MNLFDLPVREETASPPALRYPQPKPSQLIVGGYWKHYVGPVPPTGEPAPLPTLNHNPHDGHRYTRTKFSLAPGVSLGVYPISEQYGITVKGQKDLISLYDAVQQGLAKELT